ncbi:MAG: beta-ketoacyl-ACP synthase II [Opitutales bacterium]|nr:beta-ketoacyl-ACP synthase II [Opitutales bacterium]
MSSSNFSQRVVVTGMGVVSSLGNEVDEFYNRLLAGESGISTVDSFDTEKFACRIGAECKDFKAEEWMDPKEARRSDRYAHFALAASKKAVASAGLDMTAEDPGEVGVLVGSGIGGMWTIENQSRVLHERGPRRVSPFMIPSLIANIASGLVAIEFGMKGPNFAVVSACATATHAIGESLRIIRSGEAQVMIAGGSEAAITPLGYAGFCSMKAMSTRNDEPQRASRPFDRGRDGFIMGEGAGIVVLETLEHALARGANILGEIKGYAATCDAYHVTAPETSGAGLSLCMKKALKNGGLEREQVDYINAHGTSTPFNDRVETKAVKDTFGDHAYRLKMSSTKSMTGHLLGAAGGVEAIVCLKAIETGEIAPTINYEEPEDELDLDYVPNQKVSAPVEIAMSNNLGFGGHNASLVVARYKP